MCVAMVIIHAKTLEKKGTDDVTSKESNFVLCETVTMSQGAALFCGIMESSRWREVGRGCGIQQRPVGSSLESLWDALPESCQGLSGSPWGAAGAISSLLQDLSLSDGGGGGGPSYTALSTAPPSKRQCRSLSCSDELAAGCRSPWRPQGSRAWTAVEKRRCHSGGSVAQRSGHSAMAVAPGNFALFPGMQRSSSFSLPTCTSSVELPSFSPTCLPFPSAFTGLIASPTSPSSSPSSSPSKLPCPLYLSHEQICLPEPRGPIEACSSSDSTPELGRRGGQGGLARSRSQPCVLNEKKIGVKRRRPADTHKQRPSLDLAKMTQKLRNFHSLSCPGITGEDESPAPPTLSTSHAYETLTFASACYPSVDPHCSSEGEGHLEDDDSADDQDADPPGCGYLNSGTTNGKEREPLWAGLCE